MNQIEQYHLLPNPTKLTDSKAAKYIEEYGDESWELDALKPNVLRDLIRDAVTKIRVHDLWVKAIEEEADHIRQLESIIEELQ